MACDAPVNECLAMHWKPYLANAKITKGGYSIQARCPAHTTAGRESLTISAGEYARITWQCWNECDRAKIRRELIRAGIPESCVPRTGGPEISTRQVIDMILTSATPSNRAAVILRALLVNRGYADWPRGRELLRLAAEAGISRTVAFDVRGSGPLLPEGLTKNYTPTPLGPVKSNEFPQAGEVLSAANESGPPDKSGPPDFRKSGGPDSFYVETEPGKPKPRKPRASNVTPGQRGEIHKLRVAGVKVPEIMARFDLSQPAVYRHLGLPCAAAGTCAVCPVASRAEEGAG